MEDLLSVSVHTPINSMFPGCSWNKSFQVTEEKMAYTNLLSFGDYFLNILHPPAVPKSPSDGCQASNDTVDRPRICSKSHSTDLIAANKILLEDSPDF